LCVANVFGADCPRKAAQKAAKEAEDKPKKSVRVLVVEDNLVNQRLATVLIKKQGCEVDIAGDGLICLEKLKEKEFDLIVMDLQMPNMGGLDATKRIREIEQSDEIAEYAGLKERSFPVPIVGLSAHAKKEDADESMAAGMNDFLTKPINKDKFVAVLEKIRAGMEDGAGDSDSASPANPTRVLVVDDNKVNQKLATVLISREGCVVDVADDGLLAIEALKASEFDIVFMDLQMPNLGGLDATKRIREIEGSDERNDYAGFKAHGSGVPIYGLSAHARKEDADRCIEAGMQGFLTKPIVKDKLIAVLNEVKSAQ